MKLKTNKAIAKRFKKTKNGKIIKRTAGQGHGNMRESGKTGRNKKRERRQLNNVKINAGARKLGTTYSRLMGALKKKNINLNRKVLAEMAMNAPKLFDAVIAAAK